MHAMVSLIRSHIPIQEVVKALLYTGNAQNPNFHQISHDVAAQVLAWSVGPSGRNVEYFLSGAFVKNIH